MGSKRDTYIIEYEDRYFYDREWLKKGRDKIYVIETYNFSDMVKTLDFNNKQL